MGLNSGRQMKFTWLILMYSGWVIWKDFMSEIVIVRRSSDQMEVWSGIHKKDVDWSNGRFQGWKMCGLGTWWDWRTAGCSETSKPRLMAHEH